MYKIIGADGKEYGPIAAEQVRQWILEGRANGQTQALAEGAMEWKPLSAFPEFSQALTGAAAPVVTPEALQAPPVAPRTNPLAITGLVMGILALMFCCCYGLPFNLLGIIFSLVALSQIKQDPQREQGRGLAIAGLALSIASIVLALVFLVLSLALNSSDVLRKIEKL